MPLLLAAVLHTLPGISHRILHALLKTPQDLHAFARKPTPALLQKYRVLPKYHTEILHCDLPHRTQQIETLLQQLHIHIDSPHHNSLLAPLLRIDQAPALLYCSQAPHWNTPPIAIVGARGLSTYGKEVASYFTRYLAQRDYPLISGFAYGVDQEVHRASMECQGSSIAVLGCGLDIFLRKQHKPLPGITFFSDFPLGTQASKFTFPLRNRIISGLSSGVLIIEAKEKSGTLLTAHHTLKQGKPLWIIPGDIFSEHLRGSHELLKSGLGTLVTHPSDIIEALPTPGLTPIQQSIFEQITTPYSLQTIVQNTGLALPLILTELSDLEFKGYIIQGPHGYEQKNSSSPLTTRN